MVLLGASWLAQRGTGPLPAEQREELKTELLRELAARPGVRLEAGVLGEIDRFLDSGRVSESNLDRLERHIVQRCAGIPAGGPSAASVVSDFSLAPSARFDGPRSARLPGRLNSASGGGAVPATPRSQAPVSPRMPAVPELLPLPEGPIEKWSDVAKYAKALEEKEKVEKREALRSKQRHMAQELLLQIEKKRQQSKARQDEERRLFETQEADLERWKATQAAQVGEIRRRALEEKKEREMQNAENLRRRDEERQQKMWEDGQLVERAARELDQERQNIIEKKAVSRARQMEMWKESTRGKADAGDVRRAQYEDERRKVQEYREMLDQQEIRNRQVIPPIRGENVVIVSPPGGRKGGDFYTEENVMRQLKEVTEQAESAEQEKLRSLREQRQHNQDYLFQQIAERNKNRERALEQKRNLKVQAQAATAEYLEAERRRMEDMRGKNVQHRLELEKQMAAKKAAIKPKSWEDNMSPAEKAINQQLIKEAEDLRQQQQHLLELTNGF